MKILPAIDLKEGRCVRLVQGLENRETVYGNDPASQAKAFMDEGAEMLHLVDLDGAFSGATGNLEAIQAVRAAVDIPIELGGGMRSLKDIEGMLALGIDSVIVGTMAVKDPESLARALDAHGGERVQLGLDAKEGKVAVAGWVQETDLEAVAFALSWKAKGVERVIFTDIARDGMMTGPNLGAIEDFASGSGVKVTASGGVSQAADVQALAALESKGVDRVIIGKALYEGAFTLREVL